MMSCSNNENDVFLPNIHGSNFFVLYDSIYQNCKNGTGKSKVSRRPRLRFRQYIMLRSSSSPSLLTVVWSDGEILSKVFLTSTKITKLFFFFDLLLWWITLKRLLILSHSFNLRISSTCLYTVILLRYC